MHHAVPYIDMIKFKSLIVIILSSVLISSAILLTIFGLSLYISWKEMESTRIHEDLLAFLDSKLYGEYVAIHDIQAKYDEKDMYKGKCLIEGSIKNNGYRTITSLEFAVEFFNSSGEIIHTERILPLRSAIMPRKTTIAALSLLISGKEQPLSPGKTQRFRHVFGDQKNKSITSPIKNNKFATNPNEWSGRIDHRITRVKF